MKLKLNPRKLKRTRKMRGGNTLDNNDNDDNNDDDNDNESNDPISDVSCFLNSERGREMANLFSEFNMSDKDWAQLKRNFISLSEKLIEDVAFKPAMALLATKVNASLEYINDASDEIENNSEDEDDKPDCIDTLLDSMGFDDEEIESKNESREESNNDSDASGADADTNASGADASDADANASGADASGADASDADASGADADTSGADASGADADADTNASDASDADTNASGGSRKRTPKARKKNKRVTFKKH